MEDRWPVLRFPPWQGKHGYQRHAVISEEKCNKLFPTAVASNLNDDIEGIFNTTGEYWCLWWMSPGNSCREGRSIGYCWHVGRSSGVEVAWMRPHYDTTNVALGEMLPSFWIFHFHVLNSWRIPHFDHVRDHHLGEGTRLRPLPVRADRGTNR